MFFGQYEKLRQLGPRYIGSSFTPAEITALIRRQINQLDVRVFTRRDQAVSMDHIAIGGVYDHDCDDHGEPCIELYATYHPAQVKCVWSRLDWDRVSFDLAEALGHELVHQQQHYRGRSSKEYSSTLPENHPDHEDQCYLGSAKEIEAYGFTIAAELICYHNGDMDQLYQSDIVMWNAYCQIFANNQSVVLKLREQVIKYLNKLKVIQNAQTNTRRTRSNRGSAGKPGNRFR